MEFLSESVKDTEEFAFNFAKTVNAPQTICLMGDLGAGKTAFTRGFARYFGVKNGVSSPTFTIMHNYKGTVNITHFDLYRINDPDELYDIGFYEYTSKDISIIEWADNFIECMPKDAIYLYITYTENENERIIRDYKNENIRD